MTYYRYERKKNRVVVYDAHSDERDKKEGYYITLKAKKGVSGIKEARCLLDKKNRYPVSVRIKLGIFHTTIKISDVKIGGITDDLFEFPKEQYRNCKFVYKN